MSKTMADVLAAHLPVYKFSYKLKESVWACSTPICDVEGEFPTVIAHQCDELSSAGFGLLSEAMHKGWSDCVEEAAKLGVIHEFDAPDLHSINPHNSAAANKDAS